MKIISKTINGILHLKWHRKIKFQETFSFDYQGEGYYYINKRRYKVRRENGSFWIRIDNPFYTMFTPTKHPSDIKVTIQETQDGNWMDLEFYANVSSKILEIVFEVACIYLTLLDFKNKAWIHIVMPFFMMIVAMVATRISSFIETRYVISDLKTLCDRKKEE
ncbi:MAG: hypothetical protein MJZ34_15585 [Paludibacteraceae bacterium]|nr:hypothetical protein [Paludibacteraceae bacterium]